MIFKSEESYQKVLDAQKRGRETQRKKSKILREKLLCPTCGKKNDSSHKFCSACGTFLE